MSSQQPLAERLRPQLAARGFELVDIPDPITPAGTAKAATGGGTIEVSATTRHSVRSAGHGTLDVMIPVALRVRLNAQGDLDSLIGGKPAAADVSAAETWLDDLIASDELDDTEAGKPQPRATHQVVREADGSRVVRRRGFKTA